MNQTHRTNSFLTVANCALIIAAGCGDGVPGAVDENGDAGTKTLTGFLVDSPVSGVSYETATQSGVTGSDGHFLYREGETVRFFLGDTTLGEAVGQEQLTPFDLAGIDPLTTGLHGFLERRTEVSRVVNIAGLLQTFDFDGDPANGIEITAEVAALFDGVEVDLNREVLDFFRERTFRTLLNRANDAALLESYRAPHVGASVMDHIYEELGLVPGFFATRSESFDQDGDGTNERLIEYTYEGNITTLLITNFATPLAARTVNAEYNDRGNVTSAVEEEAGATTSFTTVTLDADGNLVLFSTDTDADGAADSLTERFYNQYGDFLGWASDADADGQIDTVTTFEYDERGDWIRGEFDNDADGSANAVQTFEWNEDHRVIRQSLDSDADGVFETVMTFEYDGDGREIRRAEYEDGGLVPIKIQLWEYDARGLETLHSWDDEADDVPDILVYSHYDAQGYMVVRDWDKNGDGQIDDRETWVRDANGNELRYDSDRHNDGTLDWIVTKTYVPIGWRFLFEWLAE